MESGFGSNIEREIETAAMSKPLFTSFDESKFDLYTRLLFNSKMQTDSLSNGKQRPQKDLAILYKRIIFNSNLLISSLPRSLESHHTR